MHPTPIATALLFMLGTLAGSAATVEKRPSSGASAESPALDSIEASQAERQPRPKFQARPVYPTKLRKNKVSGEAVVDFIVDVKGNVQRAYAIRSTHPEFAEAAVACVSKWKFDPGEKGGRPVNTHMQVPIVFQIN